MASKSNCVESNTWGRGTPPARTWGETCVRATYDREEKTFLDRTPKRWGKLLLFYFTFYIVLASQFSICLATFHQHSQSVNPRVKRQGYSLSGSSPSLEFRPLPSDARSTLISYKGTAYENYKYWEDQLKEFLSDYKIMYHTAAAGQNIYRCDFENPPPPGMVCDVDVREFGPCVEENHFSYQNYAPCIFLRLNKFNGWRPEFYNDTSSLPEDMPVDLQSQIKELTELNRNYGNMVWVSCQGETPADKEFIGSVRYFPNPGFPGYFFPYNNTEGYLSPLVAVQFLRPRTGIVINIECRAWARNIQYNRKEHLGTVHFELMIN